VGVGILVHKYTGRRKPPEAERKRIKNRRKTPNALNFPKTTEESYSVILRDILEAVFWDWRFLVVKVKKIVYTIHSSMSS
jgi:hypothetical protein